MWPSRMPRTASAIGSFMSSPSTSTVYRAVIEPEGEVPERSSSFGSIAKTRRRVAARGGRLADREADLALGHREAGDRVHHQHHVAALVAEVLRDGGRGEGGLQAHQRGLVGGRADHDGAREALFAEVALHELEHLSATLADQADDVDLFGGRAGDHAQQRRLADAGAGEDAEALAAPAGHHGVQRAHAQRHAVLDPGARKRVGRRGLGRDATSCPGSGPCRPADARGRRARGPAGRRLTLTASGWPEAVTRAPGPMPAASPSAISSVRPARKPTTSAGTDGRPRPVSIVHTSPTSASRPVASTIRPIRSTTRPVRRLRSASRIASEASESRSSLASTASSAASITENTEVLSAATRRS